MSKLAIHPPLGAAAWPVMREWAALDDLCIGVFDCPHTTPELTNDGPFVVRSQDVRSGVFRLEEAGRVSEDTYKDRIARAEPIFGDILYSREGTYFGNAAEVPAGVKVCLGQRMVLIQPRRELINSRFLRFWLNSPILKEHILGFRDGSVAERLNMPTIRNIPVPLVPMAEQRRLSGVLGALDDKIELNRRMNETLEAMAQEIFRDWFVDFGPVRRKLAGKTDPVAIMGDLALDPARAAELVALFPDALDEDGMPAGWRASTLADLAVHCKGSVTPIARPDTEFEHYSLPAFDSGQEPAIHVGADIKSNKTPVAEGAVLLSKLNPEIRRVWLPNPPTGREQIASTEFLIFQPRPGVGRSVLYCLFRDPTVRQILSGMVTGTSKSHQRISPPALLQTTLLVGDGEAFDAFGQIVEPMLQRRLSLRAENRTLAETRDYLLPRLMSGAVRVGDTAATVA